MVEKAYIMKVFPSLEEYWDRDGGVVFNDAYAYFQKQKRFMYHKWNKVLQKKKKEALMIPFEIESFCVRLVPEEEDPRPYATAEDMEAWKALSEKTLEGSFYLEREEYLRTMEKLNSYKLPDERNCSIMEAQLIVGFEIGKILEDVDFL